MKRLLLDYKLSFNSLARKRCSSISKYVIFKHFVVSDIWKFYAKLPSEKQKQFPLVLSEHGFRNWLVVVKQEAITWTYVDPDLCRNME